MRRLHTAVTALAAAGGALAACVTTPTVATFRSEGPPPRLVTESRTGGTDAPAPPFMASLQLPGRRLRHYCGGSLISRYWVLTAAHCLYDSERPIPATEFVVRIGSDDIASGGAYVRARRSYVPAGYVPKQSLDIALVKLAKPVDLDPVPIAASAAEAGTWVRLPGWGQPCPKRGCGGPRRYLKQPETQILDSSACRNRFDPATELCIGVRSGETVCYGDSGGPALAVTGGRWQLVGVTSRFDEGSICGESNAVYTDVSAYLEWISWIMGGGAAS